MNTMGFYIGAAVWGIVGILLIFSGIKAGQSYKKQFTERVVGKVVSSHYESYTENDNKYFDMYATVNYEIDGIMYQKNFEYEKEKNYYHFLSHGNYVSLCFPQGKPQLAQIERLFIGKGRGRIFVGVVLSIISICIFFCAKDLG